MGGSLRPCVNGPSFRRALLQPGTHRGLDRTSDTRRHSLPGMTRFSLGNSDARLGKRRAANAGHGTLAVGRRGCSVTPGGANVVLPYHYVNGHDPSLSAGERPFERIVRGLRVPLVRLHDPRHTHAPLALAAGIHSKVVQERLGHSSITMSLDLYSHAVPAMQADAAATIAALHDAAVGGA